MAKHRAESLEGLLLDAAVASVDPRCQGLTLGVINGVLCGYTVESWGQSAAIVLPGPGAVAWTKARKAMLGCKATEFASTYAPSSSWADGGPLIEREGIAVFPYTDCWAATRRAEREDWIDVHRHDEDARGPTPLVAAMRALVLAKLGEEVDLPDLPPQ